MPSLLTVIGIAVVVPLAIFLQAFFRRHWYFAKVNAARDFSHEANYTRKTLPITYYEVGHLSDVLKGWHDDFHLYRVKPGTPPFVFNHKSVDSPLSAHRVPAKLRVESFFCSPMIELATRPQLVNMSTIFAEPGWYASFSKASRGLVAGLWDELKLDFSSTDAEMEHAFVSNFEKPVLTSPVHAAPMVLSMSVQFIGSKSWIFFPPEDYTAEDGFSAVPAASTLRPQRAPKRQFAAYEYTSEPGDVLFFRESWGHVVYTHKGPNIMINYRNIIPNNFLRQPITFLTALINAFALGRASKAKDGVNEWPMPEQKFNMNVASQIDNELCPDGTTTAFDKSMLRLLHSFVDKVDQRLS